MLFLNSLLMVSDVADQLFREQVRMERLATHLRLTVATGDTFGGVSRFSTFITSRSIILA